MFFLFVFQLLICWCFICSQLQMCLSSVLLHCRCSSSSDCWFCCVSGQTVTDDLSLFSSSSHRSRSQTDPRCVCVCVCGQSVVFNTQGSTRKKEAGKQSNQTLACVCADEECNNRKIGRIINKFVHLNCSPVGGPA